MPDPEETRKQRVVYTIPNIEQVTVRKNLTYKTIGEVEWKMDVYYPTNFQPDTLRPAVIFVHGDQPPERIGHSKDGG